MGRIQRILFVQPPIEDFYTTAQRQEPLGLEYLAGALLASFPEIECRILDCRLGGKRELPLPAKFRHLAEFYPAHDESPFRLFGKYYRFGLSTEAIRSEIGGFSPDLVAISALFNAYYRQALEVAQVAKQAAPGATVVLGGGFPSACPEEALDDPAVDFVIRGEGEEGLCQLIGQKEAKGEIPGLCFRRADGSIHLSPPHQQKDFAALPSPWRAADSWCYRIGREKLASLLFSRGCPEQCLFCSSLDLFGPGHRTRPVEAVIGEMKSLKEERGITAFNFEDDNLTANRSAARQLFQAIVEEFGERRLKLYAMNGLSYFSSDPELLELFHRAGLQKLDISLALSTEPSASTAYTRRRFDWDGYRALLGKAENLGLPATSYFIAGLPGQTAEELVETLATLYEVPTLAAISIFYLVPGTRMHAYLDSAQAGTPAPLVFQQPKQSSIGDPSFFARSSAIAQPTAELSRLDLATLFLLCRVVNFVKGEGRLGPQQQELGRTILQHYLKTGEFWLAAKGEGGGPRFLHRPFSAKVSALFLARLGPKLAGKIGL